MPRDAVLTGDSERDGAYGYFPAGLGGVAVAYFTLFGQAMIICS